MWKHDSDDAGADMIHIAFDARMVRHSGIGTHIRGLAESMVGHGSGPDRVEFTFLGDPQLLREYPCFRDARGLVRASMPVYGVREQLMFPRVHDADAYHFPHYNVPFGLRRPFFVTVHDLIHLLFPEFVASRPKRWLGRHVLLRAVRKALALFTVSERSRRDLVEVLGVAPERVVVVPNAVSETFRPLSPEAMELARSAMDLPQRFLLAVGINKPHKNLRFLVEAFCQWRRRAGSDMRLVLCGPRLEDKGELLATAAEGEVAGHVIVLPYMDHRRMPALYQAAQALVFPSLYEGFGLPLLEAQRVGTPVIASSAASIPEVAGDGALYFDPGNREELIGRLDELAGDDTLRCSLRQRGFANEQRYRWDVAAQHVLDTYRRCLGR